MRCWLCDKELTEINKESCFCKSCNLLFNKKAIEKDYYFGGGQDIPSKYKAYLRRLNSKKRWEIIKPFLLSNKKYLFIDIGSGSGEMIEIAKNYSDFQIGFEPNRKLVDYCIKKGLNCYNTYFSSKILYEILKKEGVSNKKKIFALCHVIEHLQNPKNLLFEVKNSMKPGDMVYIEVPLFTGHSFKRLSYNWKLWYDEHFHLYSIKSLIKISELMNLNILDFGHRAFAGDSLSILKILEYLFKYPLQFLRSYFNKKKYHMVLDNFLKDFGFILLIKT